MVADADDPLVGQELGPFRIGALLGRGGMGAVYAAEHAVLGRRVAIKLLEPHLTVDPDALGRFVEEARAVNSIRHPNIIDITDFGNLEGRPYFVMELLEGETLGARIAQWGHLPLASTLRICAQVASALTAAHDRGIVHRDLKPDNVFICNHPDYPDHVKVLDFGIAKLMRPSGQSGKKLSTQAGMVLGTPLYMSPEQSLGDTIDPRSDVYALGIVLYEALTGTSPFDRPSVAEILIAHVHDMPPSPRAIEPSIPEALEALILRALAKSPSHRFDDMRQMRAALLACTDAPATKRVIQIVPTPTSAAESMQLAAASTAAVPAVARTTAKTAPAVIGETLRGIILQRIAANRLVLPTLPKATNSALAALRKPDANLAHIAAMLEEDPLIAPQLLRVASSAVYGGTTVPSVAQAVVRLGVRRLRSLLFELSVRRVFTSPRPSLSAAFRGLWRHSVLVAMLARRICNELGNPVDAEAVHLAGLLHDVGKPLVGAMLLEAEKLIGKSFQIDLDTWIEIVGQSHREVANALAVKWQLVPELRHAIASSDQYHPGALTTNIVCFANAIAKHAGQTVGPIDNEAAETLIAEGTELLGIDWRFVHVLRTAIEEFVASDDD
ncbi:MAG: HDOD domain-containing protein [Kofleriaceae bacterium]